MSNTATQVIQQDKLDREAYLKACQDYIQQQHLL